MPFSFLHTFHSLKTDGPDASLLQPSYWNDEHTVTAPANSLAGNSTGSTGDMEAVAVGAGLSLAAAALTNPSAAAALLVGATSADVPNGRVPTATTTISWDMATALQAKANVVDASITLAKMEHGTKGQVFYYTTGGVAARLNPGAQGQVFQTNGTGQDPSWGYAGAAHAIIQDKKASGSAGGTATSGAWRDRTLNYKPLDAFSMVSLGGNVFTLAAGSYVVEWSAPAHRCFNHQTRLWNDTAGSTVASGSSESATDGADVSSRSTGIASFTIPAGRDFKIQHRVATTRAADGFGDSAGFGEDEIYTTVKIWRTG